MEGEGNDEYFLNAIKLSHMHIFKLIFPCSTRYKEFEINFCY